MAVLIALESAVVFTAAWQINIKAQAQMADRPEPVAVVQTVAEPVIYDVPLEEELQLFIASECEKHHIDSAIALAMIEQESCFQHMAVGDEGRSLGLMQIQTRWHEDRMEKLGVTDLFDPFQNVQVGIDYLAEMMDRDNGLEWALTAYNAGPSKANELGCNSYAKAVLAKAEALKAGENNVLHG